MNEDVGIDLEFTKLASSWKSTEFTYDYEPIRNTNDVVVVNSKVSLDFGNWGLPVTSFTIFKLFKTDEIKPVCFEMCLRSGFSWKSSETGLFL